MFRASLAHHQEFKETVFEAKCHIQLFLILSFVCHVMYSYLCKVLWVLKLCAIAHHSRTHKTLHRYITWQTKDRIKNNWIDTWLQTQFPWTPDDERVTLETCRTLPSNKEHKAASRWLFIWSLYNCPVVTEVFSQWQTKPGLAGGRTYSVYVWGKARTKHSFCLPRQRDMVHCAEALLSFRS